MKDGPQICLSVTEKVKACFPLAKNIYVRPPLGIAKVCDVDFIVEVDHYDQRLDFEALQKLSVTLDTKKITLGVDLHEGCPDGCCPGATYVEVVVSDIPIEASL